MIKHIILITTLLVFINSFAQPKIISKSTLIIKHSDITLYLTPDTCSMVSKHVLLYKNYLKVNGYRDDRWFQDTYSGKYIRSKYINSGYDLGHLTPSNITSYSKTINHYSFSMFNQAPQVAKFNRGKWMRLETYVEHIIIKEKANAIILTGVVYDYNHPKFLTNSSIRVPIAYFKILYINKIIHCWIGSNVNGEVISTNLVILNNILKENKMPLQIK